MAISLELLTDDDILDYSRADGKDHVLFSHGDLNLKFDRLQPITGGVYDIEIFGSPMVDRCICGKIHQASPDPQPCPNCGAKVYTTEAALRRFARIELGFYYLNDLRFDIFKQKFDAIFQDTKIIRNFIGNSGYSGRGSKKLEIKVFDTCQFNYSPETKELEISEFITDESKCSYEGLMKIIEEHFPEHLTEYRKLINHYYLVLPARMRPFTLAYKDGKKIMGTSTMSVLYSSIIWFCCKDDKKTADGLNYKTVMEKLSTPGERVRYTALLRAYLNGIQKELTELLKTSKENLARGLYSVRTKNSARCPIVPDVDLKIDEIGLPTHIAYEFMREGFVNYLIEKLNFTKKEALKATKEEATNPETQKLFKEYAEKQIVLINRQPTLHEYSIFAMRVKLKDQYAISYPIQICEPLNADFDGDTISVQLVPEDVAEDTYRKMSPRYVTFYKKNRKPIPAINHENLNGLAVATEWTPEDPEELKEPRYYYDDYVKLLKDVEVDKKIKIGTPIVFTYDFGNGLKYQSEVTTYGKIRISKILEKNIDDLEFTKDKYTRFDSKSAMKLSAYLCDFPEDGIEKRRELQKFCLRVVSMAGVVTFDYKTLYTETDTETYREMCKIADSTELTDRQKLCILTEKYEQYEKEIEASFSEDLKNELNRAGRVKISSISALNMPQFIVSGIDEKPIITRGSLLQGMNSKDMIYHAIENRSLQSIKTSGVPNSGSLTRQISFLLNNYIYQEGEDTENSGLLIPRYKAGGRTAPNGKVYPEFKGKANESDLVLVRSIVKKNKGDLNIVTPDLIGKFFSDFTPGAAIGLSFALSLTESTTQGALGLKHGGHERVLDKLGYLKAPKACTFTEDGKWIILKVRGGELKYPRPTNLVTLGKDKFEKGETICCAYNTSSPISKLNSMINLMRARPSVGLRYFEKDNIIVSDCYAYEDGIIKYVENENGEIDVQIGSRTYQYNSECMYYFPEGTQVKKFDRICSGVINMNNVISELKDNLNDIYLIFRKQFYTLTDNDFIKTGITTLSSTQEEIIELLFTGLTKTVYDPDTSKLEEVEYMGTQKSILSKKSFYTVLSYGYSSRIINKAFKGEVNLGDDVMTSVILGLLLNNKLDDTKK